MAIVWANNYKSCLIYAKKIYLSERCTLLDKDGKEAHCVYAQSWVNVWGKVCRNLTRSTQLYTGYLCTVYCHIPGLFPLELRGPSHHDNACSRSEVYEEISRLKEFERVAICVLTCTSAHHVALLWDIPASHTPPCCCSDPSQGYTHVSISQHASLQAPLPLP